MGTSKDADMSPFMAASKLLSMETTRMSLIDRTELVFQDMDLVPLLIQVAPKCLNLEPGLIVALQSQALASRAPPTAYMPSHELLLC